MYSIFYVQKSFYFHCVSILFYDVKLIHKKVIIFRARVVLTDHQLVLIVPVSSDVRMCTLSVSEKYSTDILSVSLSLSVSI